MWLDVIGCDWYPTSSVPMVFILTGQVSLGWHWAHGDHVAARFRVKAALPLVQPLRQHMEMRPNHWPHPAVLPGIPSLFLAWDGSQPEEEPTKLASQLWSGSRGELATCYDSSHCGEKLIQWIGMCLVFECQLESLRHPTKHLSEKEREAWGL
jgi:hypothetical protein